MISCLNDVCFKRTQKSLDDYADPASSRADVMRLSDRDDARLLNFDDIPEMQLSTKNLTRKLFENVRNGEKQRRLRVIAQVVATASAFWFAEFLQGHRTNTPQLSTDKPEINTNVPR